MQISKKLYATLIIAVLTLSTLMAAIPMASAEISSAPFLVAASPPGSTTALTNGPVGTRVSVVGNATSGAADPFATVTIYWDALSGLVLGTGDADNAGEYRITVTIPPAVNGPHWIIANDGETESGGAQFDVEAALSVDSIPPAFFGPTLALPGDTLDVEGHGFAANDDITLFLNSTTLATPASYVITTPIFHTNGTGSFAGQITVPAIPMANFDMYALNATDEAGNSAIDMVSIDYYITCFPGAGPTGITIWIMGRIASTVAYNIRFNTASIATGTTDATGNYFVTYTIPGVLSPAAYTIDIWWATTESRSTSFTVTPSPTIALGAVSGVAGDVVTISGSGFSGFADITLYFDGIEVNSTDMDDRFGPTSMFGSFSEEFVVPTLTPGTYAVSVTDSWGATSASGVFFTILPTPVTTIAPRSTTYHPMDIPSWNVWTTEVDLGVITVSVYDPSGQLWWRTDDWTLTTSDDGLYKSVMFQNQGADDYNQMRIVFPADCPLGAWNWTITYTPTSTGLLTKSTGMINVIERPSMQDVLDAIDECSANMTDLLMELGANITEMKGEVATIETTVGNIDVALADLDATITSLDGDMATVQTNLGTVQTTVSSLNTDITTIKTSVNGVTTAVGSLDAVLGVVAGDTAYIKNSLVSLNGTITDVSDGVATIQTDLGTMKVDVASIKTDVAAVQADVEESLPVTVDMMPVWIAVILSLIAAIAAIFAVVTIRQKIAG